jgi:uncharacterized protein YaiI (UPF0178 family)
VAVRVVSNQIMRVPVDALIGRVLVGDGFDAADDWIASGPDAASIVVTSDILLAERCVKADAIVLGPDGRAFDRNRIGQAVATRALMADLRAMGSVTGGPAPFSPRDRSAFLQALDSAVVKLKRSAPQPLSRRQGDAVANPARARTAFSGQKEKRAPTRTA